MTDVVQAIDGGRPPMLPWQKALLGTIVVIVAATAYVVIHEHHAAPLVVPAMPAQVATPEGGQPFARPAFDPPAPVLPPVAAAAIEQPAAPPQPETINKAFESEILAGSGGTEGARSPGTTAGDPAAPRPAGSSSSELAQRLTPTLLEGTKASHLLHPDLTILQGSQIPCLQQTAMDSSYNGFVTAILPQDIRGATGRVILLEKGTKLFGSMERAMINGLDRQFVLWIQATTPNFVRITLDSPAADEIGQTGLDGSVNQHLRRKLSGVAMLSLLQGTIQAGVQAATPEHTTSLNFSSFGGNADNLTNTMLQSTIAIPDTLHRDQGLACTAFVARDLDFSSVYALQPVR